MSTLNEDLSAIKEVEDKIIANKVARFAYTDEAYTTNDANGVAEYNVNNAQNIPTADASVLKVNETVLSRGYRAQASSVTRMLLNHFFGRMSYNLNKVNDIVSNLITTLIGHRGTANGFATLDENGRIPYTQLPESAMELKGYWNAETNTPTLSDGTGDTGDLYIVSVAGTRDLGSGTQTFLVGDRVLYASGVWKNISTDNIVSVNEQRADAQRNITVNMGNSNLWNNSWLGKVFGYLLGKVWARGTGDNTTYTFDSMYYANGIWAAGSNSHGLWWSTDGKAWTQGTGSSTADTFYSIYYANGIWVAGSSSHGLWWSTDGKAWTQGTGSNTTYRFNSVYYANGIWVAGSEDHGLWWSTDGKAWAQGTGDNTTDAFRSMYYANGIWVAGSISKGLWWSTDGKAWSQGTGNNTTYRFNSVYYANGIWVAGSISKGLWWSTDGKAWTQGTGSNTTYTFDAVYCANGIWVAGSRQHGLWRSTDGKAWTQGTGSNTNYNFNSVYYANGIWVAGALSKGLWYSDYDLLVEENVIKD